MTQWYYSDSERNRHGPLDDAAMVERHRGGELGPDTLVWRDGLSQWRPWREVAGELIADSGFAAPAASDAGAERTAAAIAMAVAQAEARESSRGGEAQAGDPDETPPQPRTTAPDPAREHPSSSPSNSDHRSVAPQPATENPAEPLARDFDPLAAPASPYAAPRADVAEDGTVVQGFEVVPAGFWKRLAAYMLDSLVVTFVYYAIGAVVMFAGMMLIRRLGDLDPVGIGFTVVSYGMFAVVSVLYYAGMESSASQATLGKMALGIKVVDANGLRLKRGRALARWAASVVSFLTLCVGFLLIAFTDRKLGLHDMIAKTQVVDRWAYTARPELQRRELGPVGWVVLILGLLLWLLGAGAVVFLIDLAANVGH